MREPLIFDQGRPGRRAPSQAPAVAAVCDDLPAALAAIRARVLLMPSESDLYFRVADNVAGDRVALRVANKTTPIVFYCASAY